MIHNIHKLIRFASIYGWSRAVNKAIARTRPPWLRNPFVVRRQAVVSVIGCGQFAFSCVCFFLQKHRGNRFLSAFDTSPEQARSLARYYDFREVANTVDSVLNHPALQVLYVVSNHASHTDYAIAGLKRNKTVYVEKPVSVTRPQLVQLAQAVQQSEGQVFAGYNRPYAKAIQLLKEHMRSPAKPGSFSISYTINGHLISPGHWYRNPEEGTRICGNLGHWIDLTIHLMAWRGLPNWIDIQMVAANPAEPDDNLTVTLTTDRYDLVSILLTSRSEPYEGISESIDIQYNTLIARIDDFRRMTVWQETSRKSWRFSPKDVGHERAVLQPFRGDNRAWSEVELSTLLMLFIRDRMLDGQATSRFSIAQELSQLDTDIQAINKRSPTIRL